MPLYYWRERVRAYLGEHFGYIALIGLMFMMGIIFGALTVNNLAPGEQQNLLGYLRFFLRDLTGPAPLRGSTLARDAIWTNAKTLAFLFLLGVTAIGTPFILLVVFTRGFVLGFTVGFLIKQLLLKGFLFALVGVVPHNLILVPALLLAGVANLDFGVALIKSRLTRRPVTLGREFLACLAVTGLALLVFVGAGLIEGYISPVLMAWMAKYLS
ncbi:MAG: stage II sporulation protein M [Bacteroidota bacterium]